MKATANPLSGITRPGRNEPINPGIHNPLRLQNRVLWDHCKPDGTVDHYEQDGNVMVTYGLNRLIEMLASDASGASDWVGAGAIGTDTTVAASGNTALGGSTAKVVMSAASMVASDLGNFTLQYNMTFDGAQATTPIAEVGLFQNSADVSASMIARSILSTTINKASNDTINISYQIIASTV